MQPTSQAKTNSKRSLYGRLVVAVGAKSATMAKEPSTTTGTTTVVSGAPSPVRNVFRVTPTSQATVSTARRNSANFNHQLQDPTSPISPRPPTSPPSRRPSLDLQRQRLLVKAAAFDAHQQWLESQAELHANPPAVQDRVFMLHALVEEARRYQLELLQAVRPSSGSEPTSPTTPLKSPLKKSSSSIVARLRAARGFSINLSEDQTYEALRRDVRVIMAMTPVTAISTKAAPLAQQAQDGTEPPVPSDHYGYVMNELDKLRLWKPLMTSKPIIPASPHPGVGAPTTPSSAAGWN